MPEILEKVFLALCVGLLLANIATNPMGLDKPQRWLLGAALFFLACFLAYTVSRYDKDDKEKRGTPPPASPTPETLRGIFLPGNDPTPPNPCGETPPNNIAIYLGNSAALSFYPTPVIVQYKGENLLWFERTTDGLYVNAIVRNAEGKEVAKITRNVIRVSPSSGYYAQQPDNHTLIVLDDQDRKALFVRYLNPTAIKVLGIFYGDRLPQAIFEEDGQVVAGNKFSGFCFDMRDAGVLFSIDRATDH